MNASSEGKIFAKRGNEKKLLSNAVWEIYSRNALKAALYQARLKRLVGGVVLSKWEEMASGHEIYEPLFRLAIEE